MEDFYRGWQLQLQAISWTRKPDDNHHQDGVRKTRVFWRPLRVQQVGHCSLKPEHFQASCGNTKGSAPGSRSCAQDQEPESRCVCVLKERPSKHQNGGKTHLPRSLRHTGHRLQSHSRSVFQNGHHTLTVVRRCPGP